MSTYNFVTGCTSQANTCGTLLRGGTPIGKHFSVPFSTILDPKQFWMCNGKTVTSNTVITGGCDKVKIFKVDQPFWLLFLGRIWWLSFRSTENEYIVKVDIDNCTLHTLLLFCRPKAQSSMSTLRPKSFFVDLKCNFHVDLLNFDLKTPPVITTQKQRH